MHWRAILNFFFLENWTDLDFYEQKFQETESSCKESEMSRESHWEENVNLVWMETSDNRSDPLGAGQLWVHIFPWKKWVLMMYEINHIWTAGMKWKWRNDRRSERNLCNCVKKPKKKLLQIGICECQLYVCMFNKVVLEKKKEGEIEARKDITLCMIPTWGNIYKWWRRRKCETTRKNKA